MPNSYFQFKQFTIHQEHCAMKVCTDACLFGAWVNREIKTRPDSIGIKLKNILDIGTGTGLLSLMIAQQTDAMIDGVEIDETASLQAADNLEASPWKDRLQVIQGDIRKIHLVRKYDLIISNPPFFENSLKSIDKKRNLALHNEGLALEELIFAAKNNIAGNSMFAVLLPHERADECKRIAGLNGFYLSKEVNVRQSTKHGFFRCMLLFVTEETTAHTSEISIRDGNEYTTAFIELLKEYYLYL